MLSLMVILSFAFLLAIFIIITASALSKKSKTDREKTTPFECGFDPFSNSRIPFSLRFFMIAIIFLVFDVEIAILLPIPLLFNLMDMIIWAAISSILVFTLIIGLIHEWNFGALDWTK